MKRILLFVLTILIGILLIACGSNLTALPQKEEGYESIENGLVGETKCLVQQMAEFACSDDFLLYTADKDVLKIAASFAKSVKQYDTPLSAKRYVIDRNSICDNPSGGAMSHEEVISYYAKKYPALINNTMGVSTVAATAVLTINSAYPQPEEFSGTQIIELKYSSDLSVFAVYTETENKTVTCTVLPVFGEINGENCFSSIATSGNMGITFTCSEYSCDPTVTGSLFGCKIQPETDVLSQKAKIQVAQNSMKTVGKKANMTYLNMVGCPADSYEYSLSCQPYCNLAPSYAIVWSNNNLLHISGLEEKKGEDGKLLDQKLVQGLPGYICSESGDFDRLVSQSLMETTSSFSTSEAADVDIICLLYENEEGVFAGMVSFCSTDTGCVLVNATPLWNVSAVNSIVDFYNTGKEITEYSDSLNKWLMNGERVKI